MSHPGLFEMAEVESAPGASAHPHLRRYRQELTAVAAWARAYLCRPHPELGRRGPVCPYAQSSIDRERFYLAVSPGRPSGVSSLVEAVEPYREWFLSAAPRQEADALHTAVLVLFPDATGDLALIDAAQNELKARYVAGGLMIGEFHDGPPDKPGLWNPLLRPLASPVPMLVIRHMVATDLPFLSGYTDAYHRLFGERRRAVQVESS